MAPEGAPAMHGNHSMYGELIGKCTMFLHSVIPYN